MNEGTTETAALRELLGKTLKRVEVLEGQIDSLKVKEPPWACTKCGAKEQLFKVTCDACLAEVVRDHGA